MAKKNRKPNGKSQGTKKLSPNSRRKGRRCRVFRGNVVEHMLMVVGGERVGVAVANAGGDDKIFWTKLTADGGERVIPRVDDPLVQRAHELHGKETQIQDAEFTEIKSPQISSKSDEQTAFERGEGPWASEEPIEGQAEWQEMLADAVSKPAMKVVPSAVDNDTIDEVWDVDKDLRKLKEKGKKRAAMTHIDQAVEPAAVPQLRKRTGQKAIMGLAAGGLFCALLVMLVEGPFAGVQIKSVANSRPTNVQAPEPVKTPTVAAKAVAVATPTNISQNITKSEIQKVSGSIRETASLSRGITNTAKNSPAKASEAIKSKQVVRSSNALVHINQLTRSLNGDYLMNPAVRKAKHWGANPRLEVAAWRDILNDPAVHALVLKGAQSPQGSICDGHYQPGTYGWQERCETKDLQIALGVNHDSVVGPKTLNALAHHLSFNGT